MSPVASPKCRPHAFRAVWRANPTQGWRACGLRPSDSRRERHLDATRCGRESTRRSDSRRRRCRQHARCSPHLIEGSKRGISRTAVCADIEQGLPDLELEVGSRDIEAHRCVGGCRGACHASPDTDRKVPRPSIVVYEFGVAPAISDRAARSPLSRARLSRRMQDDIVHAAWWRITRRRKVFH